MESELISVIIPVYNHARTIVHCLHSLVQQSYRPFEAILVNDGSTDDFSKTIKNIKVGFDLKIIEQDNRGASAARNKGFSASRGAYVIFWDADTIAKPEMLSRLKMALDQNTSASYAYSGFKFGWKNMRSEAFSAIHLKQYNYIDTTTLIRRDDFCGFDETLKRFQDWDLWLTLLEKNKTGVYVPEVLYKKIIGGRKGMSSWLPKFVYSLPWQIRSVSEYSAAKKIVLQKHHISEPVANR